VKQNTEIISKLFQTLFYFTCNHGIESSDCILTESGCCACGYSGASLLNQSIHLRGIVATHEGGGGYRTNPKQQGRTLRPQTDQSYMDEVGLLISHATSMFYCFKCKSVTQQVLSAKNKAEAPLVRCVVDLSCTCLMPWLQWLLQISDMHF